MGKTLIWIGTLGVVALMGLSLLSGVVALSPEQLESVAPPTPKPVPVTVAPPPEVEPPSPPPQDSPAAPDPLAQLAPESFSTMQSLSAGIGFGSGGGNGSLVGGGGFGSDTASLAKERSEMNRPPRAVQKALPDYPSEARRRGLSGFVTLRLFVGANGIVESVKVEVAEPVGVFDQAAIRAARSWKFEPALSQGQTVAAWTTQKIKFELN